MDQLKDKVEWPAEIRSFIEGRLEQARRDEALERVERLLRNVKPVKAGTAARLVRGDRDSGH